MKWIFTKEIKDNSSRIKMIEELTIFCNRICEGIISQERKDILQK